ncbi:hypothetical protein Fmac_021151 [Flemingia macrophylla]|uniref:Uncharacterized protein n=1 Tax=Flemingia macrophylla TaxID=520843 RepID=A0ABD1LW01_9FABA
MAPVDFRKKSLLLLCELSFHKTRHLRNPYNENLPVKLYNSYLFKKTSPLEPVTIEILSVISFSSIKFNNVDDLILMMCNHEGEQSSPNPKKSKKFAAKGWRSCYVIKLPLQIGKSTHTPIVEPRQSQPKNVQPTPLERENVDTNPKIPSPHLNASPTLSPTQIPSTRASQYCVGRVSPLSSPSEPNHSPLSIPSTRQENVVMQEQTFSEVTQPFIPADPPPGAVLPEEFEKIFSQAKSEAASCGGGSECSPLDPSVEEKIRNQSWFTATGGRNKGCVYGVGKVQAGYWCRDSFTQLTTSSASSEKITMLEEKVRKTQEENEKLSRKFETLLNVVLPFLSAEAAQLIFQQSQENQQQQQQPPQPSNQAAENQENSRVMLSNSCIWCTSDEFKAIFLHGDNSDHSHFHEAINPYYLDQYVKDWCKDIEPWCPSKPMPWDVPTNSVSSDQPSSAPIQAEPISTAPSTAVIPASEPTPQYVSVETFNQFIAELDTKFDHLFNLFASRLPPQDPPPS